MMITRTRHMKTNNVTMYARRLELDASSFISKSQLHEAMTDVIQRLGAPEMQVFAKWVSGLIN